MARSFLGEILLEIFIYVDLLSLAVVPFILWSVAGGHSAFFQLVKNVVGVLPCVNPRAKIPSKGKLRRAKTIQGSTFRRKLFLTDC